MNRIRYNIAPQMKVYDEIGITWTPYLMFFHTPNYVSNVVNTDSRGFRVTYKNSTAISEFKNLDAQPICLFAGGSTAFGVGATNDRKTIPSLLNSNTDYLWLNFGGRAFSSTQEILLFLLYHYRINNIKKIVILSGMNNILLHYLSQDCPKELGAFFFWSQYKQAMNKKPMSIKRKMLELLLRPVYRNKIDYSNISKKELMEYIIGNKKQSSLPEDSSDAKKDELLYALERDIYLWKLFADTKGIELYYILQPLANWVDKKLSKEEEGLFAALDNYPRNHWKVLKNKFDQNQYHWFLNHLDKICKSHNVFFFDMNKAISNRQLDGEWLFVDRAHLTDHGNQIVSDIIKKEVIKQ
ncbi:hypothetical protein ACFL28_02775 [Candidatus Omnitrophota bacterium]